MQIRNDLSKILKSFPVIVLVAILTSPLAHAMSIKWVCKKATTVQATPVIGLDGTIYAPGYYLYAVAPDGKVKWWLKNIGTRYGPAAAVGTDGTIYMGGGRYFRNDPAYLYAISPNGKIKWKFRGVDGDWLAPVVGPNGTIYVFTVQTNSSGDRDLYAITPNGKLKWNFQIGVVQDAVVGPDETIYVASSGFLYAISAAGDLKWKNIYDTTYGQACKMSIAKDSTLYAASYSGGFKAITANGQVKWELDGSWGEKPAIGRNGIIYAMGGYDGRSLCAITPNGQIKWELKPNEQMKRDLDHYRSPHIGSDGTVYVASIFRLHAITEAGKLKWKLDLLSHSDLAIGKNDIIYLCGESPSGYGLYAIDPLK